MTYSNANSDLTSKRIAGVSAYATFDMYKNFGLEADVHLLSLWTPQDFAEKSYLVGIRYSRHIRRYQPYVKGLGGIGQTIAQQPYVTSFIQDTPEHFAAFAIGAGVDVRLPHNINLRAIDFEEQFWPAFDPHGITPKIISVGVAYRFH